MRSRLGSSPRPLRGFTLIELLVVMVIIVILISAVMVASSTLINKAKTSNTRALLTVVRDAVEQFEREQRGNPTITSARQDAAASGDPPIRYLDRYGFFPPDELEVFTPLGLPGSGASAREKTLAVGGAVIFEAPDDGYGPMKFYTRGLSDDERRAEHRDLASMIVAIQTLGDASSTILDRIQDRYWDAPLDQDRNPLLFLDRPDAGGPPNGAWDAGDLQIRYIVDDWGTPISYFAQRDWVKGQDAATISGNHDDWNEASTVFIRNNGGQPVIMSYGPNGKDQLAKEAMGEDTGTASLVVDFKTDDADQVNHPLNADNIYADPTLNEKLAKGLEEIP